LSNIPLPRLCYIGDVPVEASYAGQAQLYRLLKDYPPEKLLVIEHGLHGSVPSRRLPGVRYERIYVAAFRWLNTRLHRLVASWLSLGAAMRGREVRRMIGEFRPQAVLTVAHDFAWLTAARYAREQRLPLALIVHDDWVTAAKLIGPLRPWLDRRFGEIYRQAGARLCVSPFMAEELERRYGVTGTVLYPSRKNGAPFFQSPPPPAAAIRPFSVAYAGAIHTADFVRQLTALSRILQGLGGRLLLFGPFNADDLAGSGMAMQSVTVEGFVETSDELIRRLRAEADVLFLPMSFVDQEFAVNFPSKLTDYTATALPILIWGPERSSGVKWAMMESGTAAVVTDPGEHALSLAIGRLKDDADWRARLGTAAAAAGLRYFSPESAQSTFYESLNGLLAPTG
jgi:hypothetical protein